MKKVYIKMTLFFTSSILNYDTMSSLFIFMMCFFSHVTCRETTQERGVVPDNTANLSQNCYQFNFILEKFHIMLASFFLVFPQYFQFFIKL